MGRRMLDDLENNNNGFWGEGEIRNRLGHLYRSVRVFFVQ
jgi:hypothetical protein